MSFFMGVCHPLSYTDGGGIRAETADLVGKRSDLLRQAGVQWVSCDIPFPFEGEIGRISPQCKGFLDQVAAWNDAGFKVLGVTPYPAGFEDAWKIRAGAPGSIPFLRMYEEACRFLAAEFGDMIPRWQIANQLNVPKFRHPMSEDQAIEFLNRGGAGIRRGYANARIGVNMFGFADSALRMYGRLYPADLVEFDYVGANGFFGTFDPGGPDAWLEKTAMLHEMTGKPVVLLEIGYPSAGDVMDPAERAGEKTHHDLQKLPFAWRDGHTPEAQAAYLEQTFWLLSNTPHVDGAFWYGWSDRANCWHCGAADCPAGTANGLVTVAETPKPSYHAFARVAHGEPDLQSLYLDCETLSRSNSDDLRVELARAWARNEALRAEANYLRKLLRVNESRLERLRGSLFYKVARFLTRPFSRKRDS